MLAFVTGATGFVGSHVARVLAERGADLRLLTRSNSNPKNIEDLKGERIVGDLCDPDSFAKALSGCDAVFHVAADYRLWVRDPEHMYRSNVEGTRAILRGGAREWRAAGGLHLERGDHGIHFEWASRRRVFAGFAGEHDRPLQAVEVHGGADRA